MRRTLIFLVGLAVACSSAGNGPAAPTGLVCTSASKSQAVLSWTPSASSGVTYEIDREPLGGSFAKLATSGTTTFTDALTDGYATYVYEVKAIDAQGISAASNTVTVGPPPTGFDLAVALPRGVAPSAFGSQLAMTLDANDDPVLGYVFVDPNGDTDPSDSTLYAVTWNRAKYKWNAPVRIDTVGGIDTDPGERQVSMAFDASNDTLGIAYQRVPANAGDGADIVLARSTDGGATWTKATVRPADIQFAAVPSLLMAGGKIWIAYWHDYDACGTSGCSRIRVSSGTGSGSWNDVRVPEPGGAGGATQVPVGFALDSAGQPGLAFWSDPDTNGSSASSVLGFGRPGNLATVKVADTNNVQNDNPSVALAFHGTNPVVAFTAQLDPNADAAVWVSPSPDGGLTFAAPDKVPGDHSALPGSATAEVISSSGEGAIAYESGGGAGDATCGNPKLARSSDLSIWTTCSSDDNNSKAVTGSYVSVRFAGNDKLYMSFVNDGSSSTPPELGSGVWLWREP